MVKIGVIGYGYWGPNLVRNFNNKNFSRVTLISDLSELKLLKARATHDVETTNDFNTLINSEQVDAVVIATPVFSHFELGMAALNAGKHVLLEKPMASTSEECRLLIAKAEEKGLCLMVDHTFLYTGAVQKLKDLVKSGELGKLQYLDSTRINLGLLQPDINVLWDLAPHDLSILIHLFDEDPVSVQASGISHTSNGIENIAYMTVNYASDFIAHFNCSWTSPVKIRQMLVGGDNKMAVFNDMEPTEKIKVYDTGFEVKSDEDKRNILVDYRVGDIHIPKIEMKEALAGLAKDFCDSIIDPTRTPKSSSALGISVVKMLEAADTSLKEGGKAVNLFK